MILGLRQYFSDVEICGYQGFVVCPIYNFYLVPTKYERDHFLTPHIVAVTGKCLKGNVSKHYDIKTIVAPAFRFQHLHRNRTNFSDENKFTILMPFSICLKTSFANLDLLLSAMKKSSICTSQAEIIVKTHPSFATEEIKRQIKRIDQQVQISEDEFNLLLQKTHILVGSATSACVEALVYDVTVLIVANKSGINSNPIPEKYIDHYKIVYDADELAAQISVANKNKPKRIEEQVNVLEDCFQEVTHDSVRDFLTELNY